MSVIGASSINWGFTPSDILTNAGNLFQTLVPFILLGIALAFAPRLWSLLRGAIGSGGKGRK